MSILHQYIQTKISINFHVISTYLFDVILVGEKLMSFRRTFFNVILKSEKSKFFLKYFVWHDFEERNIDVVSIYYFQSDFDWMKNQRFFGVSFGSIATAHILMWFWKTKSCGHFNISFWQVFDTLKTKVLWISLFPWITRL